MTRLIADKDAAVSLDSVATAAEPARVPFDLAVADASWSWTERLFTPLADHGRRVLLIKACDWRNAWQQRRPARDWLWPQRQLSPALWERTIILPPGWMKSYPRVGMRPISWAIRNWRLDEPRKRPLVLAISYPHYHTLCELVRPDVLVYYNMDDYSLYWRSRREEVERLERRVVREAALTICCARVRADELRAAVPEAAERIIHLPHGAPARAIADAPQDRPAPPPAEIQHLPRPLVGFVGSLEDRIDWGLMERVARGVPEGSVVLVGREPRPGPQSWYEAYRRVAALPNVHQVGWKTQDEVGRYNAAFDVCLIPYLVDHPFNRVSCPTKVMDYMATSRPVVTTPLPECRLYDHLFDVAETPDDFLAAVRRIVGQGSDDGRARSRWETARASTWERTSASLLGHLRDRGLGLG